MSNISVRILDWPTGSGKTFGVIHQILPNSSTRGECKRRILSTVVVLPKKAHKKAWIRDLGLQYIKRGWLSSFDSDFWRKKSTLWQEQEILKVNLPVPIFLNYSDFFKSVALPREVRDFGCKFLVLDEWHRIGRRRKKQFHDLCYDELGSALAEKEIFPKRWWCLANREIKCKRREIFFCSATPINSTLEQKNEEERDDKIVEQLDQTQISSEVRSAAAVITSLSGIEVGEISKWTDFEKLKKRGIFLLPLKKNTGERWKTPENLMNSKLFLNHLVQIIEEKKNILALQRHNELGMLSELVGADEGYSYEYNYCAGIIPTKRRNKRHIISLRSKKSFGFPYERPFNPKRTGSAIRWLSQFSRLSRLLVLLAWFDVIKFSERKGLKFVLADEKVVIFCKHQGVASWLKSALQYYCRDSSKKESIRTTTDIRTRKRGKRFRGATTKNLIDEFRSQGNPKILICTDKLAESYDLHENCRNVIHFELPWSPQTLFQRVGRITRLKESGRECQIARVGHVVIPGSTEEERVNRLIRRIKLLSKHHLLPGVNERQWTNWEEAIQRYLGMGSSHIFLNKYGEEFYKLLGRSNHL